MIAENKTSKGFNEVGVEAFALASLGTIGSLPGTILYLILRWFPRIADIKWLFGLGNLFTWFGFALCIFSVALAVCAYVDIVKRNMRGNYGFSVAAPFMAVFGPAIMILIRALIMYA